jgi:M6 family metalloprotease-like protein
MKGSRRFFVSLGILTCTMTATATEPPALGGQMPDAYYQRISQQPNAFTFSRALIKLTSTIRQNRAAILALSQASGEEVAQTFALAESHGGFIVEGNRLAPILMGKYSDAISEPFAPSQLEKELFVGPWPSGTMTEFYRQISYQHLNVGGTVYPWKQLDKKQSWYAGDDYTDAKGTHHCFGLCSGSRVGDFIRDTLDQSDAIEWSQYDNDGPDGKPNSGDDDGYVDFVAFVHPGIGGECGGPGNTNIWSHRGRLSSLAGGGEYVTKSNSASGGKVRINDYVIVPALACDGSTMIQIGVFAHEFGHVFGLPDLYDTTYASEGGVGNWDLMATGSWGGDGKSPERPSDMSAWSKEFLGWIVPEPISKDRDGVPVLSIEDNPSALRVSISSSQYYLISNRQKQGADLNLPASGLLIMKINQSAVDGGLPNNTVNASASNPGVQVVEADGGNGLLFVGKNDSKDRGDAGDVFTGAVGRVQLDSTSVPKSKRGSFCKIRVSGDEMEVDIKLSSSTCPVPSSRLMPNLSPSPITVDRSAAAQPGEEVSIADIQHDPERFRDKVVRLHGKLENEGKNYFTDLRLVFRDLAGNRISVKSSLPTETPPPYGNSELHQPSLSELLGRSVDITAVIDKGHGAKEEDDLVLHVLDATPSK